MKLSGKNSRTSLSLKSLALFTLISFVSTQAIVPAPTGFAQNSNAPGGDPVPVSTAQVLNGTITVPPELGKIEESFRGNTKKTILFIQDAHDSLEAQENIAKIINHLVANYGVKTVFEEGYEGPVPTDKYFGFIKDPKIKQKVSYFLLDKLRLGGAEYAHVNRTQDFDLIGVDSLKLYSENIKAYQDASKTRAETEADLNELFNHVSILANQYFPPELKSWLRSKDRVSRGELPLLDYLKALHSLCLKTNTDSSQFPKEYSALSILFAADATKDKKLIAQLNALDSKVIFEEITRLEKNISDAFLRNEQDKKIFDYYQGLSLLKRLNQIQLTQSEYDVAQKTLQNFKTREVANFIVSLTHKSLVLSREWERHIKDAVQFYIVAQSRDQSIDGHLKALFENKEEDAAVLVFGGFHATAIKALLRKQGLNYVVISPRITKIEKRHQDYYRQLMSVGHHSFEMPFLIAQANRPPSIFFSAAIAGEETPALDELQAIVSFANSLGNNYDSELIERRLADLNQAWKTQSVGALTETSNSRSEMRGEKPISFPHFTEKPLLDAHIHSTYSDGEFTPRQIIGMSKEVGLKVISITDHDTLSTYIQNPDLFEYALSQGVELVPGVEVSTLCWFKGLNNKQLFDDGYWMSDLVVYLPRWQSETPADHLKRLQSIQDNLLSKIRFASKKTWVSMFIELKREYPWAGISYKEIIEAALKKEAEAWGGKAPRFDWAALGSPNDATFEQKVKSDQFIDRLPKCLGDGEVPLIYIVDKIIENIKDIVQLPLELRPQEGHPLEHDKLFKQLFFYVLAHKDQYYGKPAGSWVPDGAWYMPGMKEVIDFMSARGGFVFLAHPLGQMNRMEGEKGEAGSFERMMAEMGPKGLNIEAYSRGQTMEQSLAFDGMAQTYGLMVTNGSDLHGSHVNPERKLGGHSEGNKTSLEMAEGLAKAGIISERSASFVKQEALRRSEMRDWTKQLWKNFVFKWPSKENKGFVIDVSNFIGFAVWGAVLFGFSGFIAGCLAFIIGTVARSIFYLRNAETPRFNSDKPFKTKLIYFPGFLLGVFTVTATLVGAFSELPSMKNILAVPLLSVNSSSTLLIFFKFNLAMIFTKYLYNLIDLWESKMKSKKGVQDQDHIRSIKERLDRISRHLNSAWLLSPLITLTEVLTIVLHEYFHTWMAMIANHVDGREPFANFKTKSFAGFAEHETKVAFGVSQKMESMTRLAGSFAELNLALGALLMILSGSSFFLWPLVLKLELLWFGTNLFFLTRDYQYGILLPWQGKYLAREIMLRNPELQSITSVKSAPFKGPHAGSFLIQTKSENFWVLKKEFSEEARRIQGLELIKKDEFEFMGDSYVLLQILKYPENLYQQIVNGKYRKLIPQSWLDPEMPVSKRAPQSRSEMRNDFGDVIMNEQYYNEILLAGLLSLSVCFSMYYMMRVFAIQKGRFSIPRWLPPLPPNLMTFYNAATAALLSSLVGSVLAISGTVFVFLSRLLEINLMPALFVTVLTMITSAKLFSAYSKKILDNPIERFLSDFGDSLPNDLRGKALRWEFQGIQKKGDVIWGVLNYRKGETFFEVGPGNGLLALRAALNGLRVVVLEHPRAETLGDLKKDYEQLKNKILASGGSFEIIEGDVLDLKVQEDILGRYGEHSFAHVVAMDVLRPGTNLAEDVSSVHFGIYQANEVNSTLQFLATLKSLQTGTFYVNHTESLGRAIEKVARYLDRPERKWPFRVFPDLEDIFKEQKLTYVSKQQLPTLSNPLPAAMLYRFDDQGQGIQERRSEMRDDDYAGFAILGYVLSVLYGIGFVLVMPYAHQSLGFKQDFLRSILLCSCVGASGYVSAGLFFLWKRFLWIGVSFDHYIVVRRVLAWFKNKRAQQEIVIIDRLLAQLREKRMPVEYARIKAVPALHSAIENFEDFASALEMGIRLVKMGIPCCDILEIGVPLFKSRSGQKFIAGLNILEASEKKWIAKTKSINWPSTEENHRVHRAFIRKILTPIAQEAEGVNEVENLLEALFKKIDVINTFHDWEEPVLERVCKGPEDIYVPSGETIQHSDVTGETLDLSEAIKEIEQGRLKIPRQLTGPAEENRRSELRREHLGTQSEVSDTERVEKVERLKELETVRNANRRLELSEFKSAKVAGNIAQAPTPEAMIRHVRQNMAPVTVFVDAADFPSLSPEQKREYFFVTLANKAVRIVVYNERGQVWGKDLTALLKLDRVSRTDEDLEQTVRHFSNPNVPAIQLSKDLLPSAAEIRGLRRKVAFFKTIGNKSGTLATALLWAISGGENIRFQGIREENGFWTVDETLLDAIQRTYENNFIVAVAA